MADPKQMMQEQAMTAARLSYESSREDGNPRASSNYNSHGDGGPGKGGMNIAGVEFGGEPLSLGHAASLDHTIRGAGIDGGILAAINNNAWSKGNMFDIGKLAPVTGLENMHELGDLKTDAANLGVEHISPGSQLNAAKEIGAGKGQGGQGQH